MEPFENLLLTLAMAVAHMRQAQREYAMWGESWRLPLIAELEREVDALVTLHLTPSALEGGTNADLSR